MVDVVQSPQKERESNSNMQWKMTDQGQEGDGKIERSYQIIINCYRIIMLSLTLASSISCGNTAAIIIFL